MSKKIHLFIVLLLSELIFGLAKAHRCARICASNYKSYITVAHKLAGVTVTFHLRHWAIRTGLTQ